MIIPDAAVTALTLLNQNGYKAYIVGGMVRDALMGKECVDIDITTSATPEQTKQVFDGYTIIETGIKHGTVTAMIDHQPVEITTFRTDNGYADNRHPASVSFTTSLLEDTKRRDFTINSVCYNPGEGIVDYHNGQQDIKNKIIRCIGNPEERFNEDALRILRAVRFAAVLGFSIEKNTAEAMYRCKHLLKNISAERVFTELKKALCGRYIKNVLTEYTEIFEEIVPGILPLKGFEQKNPHHIYDVLMHTAVTVESLPAEPVLRLAGLLHDFGKQDTFFTDDSGTGHFYGHAEYSEQRARELLQKLKASGDETEAVCRLVKYHDVQIELTEKSVRRALNKYGKELLKKLVLIKRADNKGQNIAVYDYTEYYDSLDLLIDKVIEEEQCFSLKQLSVNGNDLKDIGIIPSKQTGIILDKLLQEVIDGNLPNSKEELLKFAEKHYK